MNWTLPSRQITSTLGFERVITPLTPFGDAPDGGWPAENDPTRPTSKPDFDSWGFDSWWTAQDWLTWHRALKASYGLDEANRIFVTAWQQQGFLASPLDARSFDTSFREYARANGFLDALYYGLGSLVRPIGTVTDIGTAVTDGISTVASISRWAIPAAALVLGYLWLEKATPKRSFR
jgi:hypothetical protein